MNISKKKVLQLGKNLLMEKLQQKNFKTGLIILKLEKNNLIYKILAIGILKGGEKSNGRVS